MFFACVSPCRVTTNRYTNNRHVELSTWDRNPNKNSKILIFIRFALINKIPSSSIQYISLHIISRINRTRLFPKIDNGVGDDFDTFESLRNQSKALLDWLCKNIRGWNSFWMCQNQHQQHCRLPMTIDFCWYERSYVGLCTRLRKGGSLYCSESNEN